MQKEYLVNKSNEITLNITDGKVDSYRVKDETQCTARVYKDGKIVEPVELTKLINNR